MLSANLNLAAFLLHDFNASIGHRPRSSDLQHPSSIFLSVRFLRRGLPDIFTPPSSVATLLFPSPELLNRRLVSLGNFVEHPDGVSCVSAVPHRAQGRELAASLLYLSAPTQIGFVRLSAEEVAGSASFEGLSLWVFGVASC
ncbi:hypothetical protein NL676_003794 [Syzygium grande]|nr:hypothetical protein NL676_003794 [Syzygium grande]